MPAIEMSRVQASTQKVFFQFLDTGVDLGTSGNVWHWVSPVTRELKVDYLHVRVKLMHCFSAAVSLNKMYINKKGSNWTIK